MNMQRFESIVVIIGCMQQAKNDQRCMSCIKLQSVQLLKTAKSVLTSLGQNQALLLKGNAAAILQSV